MKRVGEKLLVLGLLLLAGWFLGNLIWFVWYAPRRW